MDLDSSFPSYTKIYLRAITDLNITAKIINLLKESNLGGGKFLGQDTESNNNKRKNDKLDFIIIMKLSLFIKKINR